MNMRKESEALSAEQQKLYSIVTKPGWVSGPAYMTALRQLEECMSETLFELLGRLARAEGFSASGGPALCTIGRVMLSCDSWRDFEVAIARTLAYGKSEGWAA